MEKEKQKEFERETIPYMDLLYNYALRMTNDEDEAKDLLQETYLKAFRFWNQFQNGTNSKAWLFQIMKNSYINRYRKEKKNGEKISYDNIEEFYETIKEKNIDESNVFNNFFSNILDDEVIEAIEKLPDEYKTSIILCDIEELSYEEISEFLQVPVGTVRSRIHRGRKILQNELLNYAKKKGYFI